MRRIETKRHVCGELIHIDEAGKYHHRFDRDCELPPMTKCPLCHRIIDDDWWRPLYKVDPMDRQLMELTISNRFGYACSNCWGYGFYVEDVDHYPEYIDDNGELQIADEPIHMYVVLCVNCREETQGYVSPGYIGWIRKKDFENYQRSIMSLAPVIGLEINMPEEKERRSIGTSLHELGF